jgi:thiamine-monophosphate kinase
MRPDDPYRRRRAIEMRTPRESQFSPHTPLGAGAEFDSIRRMLERWGPRARGIGDDAAVITMIGERSLVISTDTSVENVHFRREWLTTQEIGYRAAAAALSDLAAMAAKPAGMLVALTVPESWRDELDFITDGIGEAAEAAAAPVIGGDTTAGGELTLTFTVLGTVHNVLLRTGAHPGDRIYVTGRLGGPRSALRDFQAGRTPPPETRARFAHPVPRIIEAMWLSEHGASSGIDISDGLAAELGHLAAASRVTLNVGLETVPSIEGMSPLEAAASGEEYELIVTSPGDLDTTAFTKAFGLELTKIGDVVRGRAGVVMTQHGEPVDLPRGYLHFTH